MAEVTEMHLPGVGVRFEFTTTDGDRVGVLCHHSGRREIYLYDERDPDVAQAVIRLSGDDARAMTELLGATQVNEQLASMQRIEGLNIDWIELPDDSPMAGRTIADGELRTRTGASVVAVIRDTTTEAAPGPDFAFEAGDVAVSVGTTEGLEQLRQALRG